MLQNRGFQHNFINPLCLHKSWCILLVYSLQTLRFVQWTFSFHNQQFFFNYDCVIIQTDFQVKMLPYFKPTFKNCSLYQIRLFIISKPNRTHITVVLSYHTRYPEAPVRTVLFYNIIRTRTNLDMRTPFSSEYLT